MFLGLVEMTFGLVYSIFSLPEWQALKMTVFAPWLTNVDLDGSVTLFLMTTFLYLNGALIIFVFAKR